MSSFSYDLYDETGSTSDSSGVKPKSTSQSSSFSKFKWYGIVGVSVIAIAIGVYYAYTTFSYTTSNTTTTTTTAINTNSTTTTTTTYTIPSSIAAPTVSKISSNSLTLNWSEIPGALFYFISFRPSGAGDYLSTPTQTTFIKTISSLSPKSNYDVILNANFGNNQVIQSGPIQAFTNQVAPTVLSKSISDINISWVADTQASTYQIYTRTSPAGQWSNPIVAPTNNNDFTGLTIGTAYDFYVVITTTNNVQYQTDPLLSIYTYKQSVYTAQQSTSIAGYADVPLTTFVVPSDFAKGVELDMSYSCTMPYYGNGTPTPVGYMALNNGTTDLYSVNILSTVGTNSTQYNASAIAGITPKMIAGQSLTLHGKSNLDPSMTITNFQGAFTLTYDINA